MKDSEAQEPDSVGSGAFAKLVLQNAPAVVVVIGTDGRIRYVNAYFERLTGHALEDLRGRPWLDACIPARDRERIRTVWARSIEGAHPHGHRSAVLCRDGTERLIEWTDAHMRDRQGRVTGIVALGEDVTGLEEVQQRHREVAAALDQGVIVRSIDGTVIECNAAAGRMFGIDPESWVGQRSLGEAWTLFTEDRRPLAPEDHPAAVALRTGRAAVLDPMGVEHRDGRFWWLRVSSRPIVGRDGAVSGVVTTLLDVTESRRLLASLTDERDRLRQVIDGIAACVVEVTPAGDVIEINEPTLALARLSRADILGRPLADAPWFCEASRATVREAVQRASVGEEWRGDLEAIFPQVGARTMEAVFRPRLDGSGRTVSVIAIGLDVTSTRRLTRRLTHAQALAKLGSFEIDLASGEAWGSEEVYRTLGVRPGTGRITVEDGFALVHPDDVADARAAFAAVVDGAAQLSVRLRIVRPDGAIAHVVLVADVTALPSGARRLEGGLLDVTDRSLEEVRLREAERLARLGNWELDLETGALDWSDEVYRIFELPRDRWALSYETLLAMVHPEDREALDRAYRTSLETGGAYELDHRIVMPDGRVKWVREQGRTEYDREGRPRRSRGTVLDITERATASAALRRSELRYRRIVTESVDGIFECEADGTLIDANPAYARMLGVASPAELIGASQRGHFVDASAHERMLAALARDERLVGHRARWMTRSGEEIEVELFVNTVRDEHGRVLGAHGIARDVTEDAQRESAMQVLSTWLSRLTGQAFFDEAAARLSALVGADGVLVGVGCPGGNGDLRLVACHAAGKVHRPRTLPIAGSLVAAVIGDGTLRIAEGASRRFPADEHLTPGRTEGLVAVPILDPAGARIGAVAVWSDRPMRHLDRIAAIVELFAIRIAGEFEREAANARFAAVFEHAPDAFLIVDSNGRIVDANPMASETFGYPKSVLCRSGVEDLVPEAARERHVDLRRSYSAYDRPRVMGANRSRLVARRQDGTTIPVEVSLSPLRLGAQSLVVVSVRDLTQRVALEQAAARHQRLEAIGTLAGGVAHDLNNALGPILMVTDALRHEPDDVPQLLETLETSARRAAGMTRQLLNFAKGGQGERVPVHLPHLVREMETIIASTFPRSVRFSTRIARELPPVRGDATALHQVLLNLCVNARDAMPGGGDLAIELSAIDVARIPPGAFGAESARPGRHLLLRVRDSGSGMPPEVLEHAFDPFFTTKGPERGTGLGLATVLGTVRSHAGFITVVSVEGRGTSFSVHLPVEEKAAVAAEASEPARDDRIGHTGAVLYVDDEELIRDMAARVLRRLGYTAFTASDGTDGLQLVAEHGAALQVVVTDLSMPTLDGLAFIRALRRLLPDVPVVAASGRVDAAMAEELQALGVEVLLQKPFNVTQLADAVVRARGAAGVEPRVR